MNLREYIRDVPEHPRPGVVFRDVVPLLADARAFAAALDELARTVPAGGIDCIAGIEARGFVFGAALAARLGVGFLPLRKPGKLPAPVHSVAYQLEYGSDRLEVSRGAVLPGRRVLLVDDVLATGGTLGAAAALIREAGAEPVAASVLIEIEALGGRRRLGPVPVGSVLVY